MNKLFYIEASYWNEKVSIVSQNEYAESEHYDCVPFTGFVFADTEEQAKEKLSGEYFNGYWVEETGDTPGGRLQHS
jgi:hypothetical protein